MAWTVTETIDKIANTKLFSGEAMYCIKCVCTADANAADHSLSAATMDIIKGGYIYLVKTVPGAGGDAPGAAYGLDLEDDDGHALVSLALLSTSAVEFSAGSVTLGVFPPIFKTLVLSFNNQIWNANVATVYIYVAK